MIVGPRTTFFCSVALLLSQFSVRGQHNNAPPLPPSVADLEKEIEGNMRAQFIHGSKPEKTTNPHGPPLHERQKQPPPKKEVYDYIVVGGGAAGCPLARTLAEAGASVLLMERGGPREEHYKTLDIFGAGIGLEDTEASQTVVTLQGVRSHIGNVLSGGTAINIAITIEEQPEYFEYLEKTYPGVKWDWNEFNKANKWVVDRVANPMPSSPYGERWKEGLSRAGYPTFSGRSGGHYSSALHMDKHWYGSSLFNATNGWYRHGSDVLLGRPGHDWPRQLEVVLRHTVDRVIFAKKATPYSRPKAHCVEYHETDEEDFKPINSRPAAFKDDAKRSSHYTIKDLMSKLFDPFGRARNSIDTMMNRRKTRQYKRVCVKPGGEIILSAGAILSPIIMYNSGIGPLDQLAELNVPVVAEFPWLGRNVSDRVLIPVGMFFKGDLPKAGFPPRICQAIGIKKDGDYCGDYKTGDSDRHCSLSTVEEISGARTAEGIICGTRYLLPPELRHNTAADAVFQIISNCANGMYPYEAAILKPLCFVVQPLVDCFRKVAANFYFTSEPKSRGYIKVARDGDIVINANYLTHPYDEDAAVRGLSNIFRIINSGVYTGIMEPAGRESCPFYIFRSFVDVLTQLMSLTRDFVSPADANLMQRWANHVLKDMEPQLERIERAHYRYARAAEASDRHGSAAIMSESPEVKAAEYELKAAQGLATYPPTLPDPDNYDEVLRFAKTYMTSIWHWVASASMGDVVDTQFRVRGVDSLSVVDASVLPQVTRMNPTATLLALGRYAARCKLGYCKGV